MLRKLRNNAMYSILSPLATKSDHASFFAWATAACFSSLEEASAPALPAEDCLASQVSVFFKVPATSCANASLFLSVATACVIRTASIIEVSLFSHLYLANW